MDRFVEVLRKSGVSESQANEIVEKLDREGFHILENKSKMFAVGDEVLCPDGNVAAISEIQDNGRVIVEYPQKVAWNISVLERL